MAVNVGNLSTTIGINTAGLAPGLANASKRFGKFAGDTDSSMGKADRSVKGFVTRLGGHMTRARGAMKTFSTSMGGIMGSFAGAFSVGTAVRGIKNSADALDTLGKTSDKLGVLPGQLLALRHAADLSGVSTEKMDDSLEQMTRRMSEAAQGTGPAVDALKELGLDARALNDAGPWEAFRQITKAMGGVANESDRVRLAYDLFGRSGTDLVNVMAGGVASIDSAMQKVRASGRNMTRDQIRSVEAMNDAFTDIRFALGGVVDSIATKYGPQITEHVQNLTTWVNENHGVVISLGKVAVAVSSLFAVLAPLGLAFTGASGLIKGVGTLIPLLATLGKGLSGLLLSMGPIGGVIAGLSFLVLIGEITGLNDKLKEFLGLTDIAAKANAAGQNPYSNRKEQNVEAGTVLPTDSVVKGSNLALSGVPSWYSPTVEGIKGVETPAMQAAKTARDWERRQREVAEGRQREAAARARKGVDAAREGVDAAREGVDATAIQSSLTNLLEDAVNDLVNDIEAPQPQVKTRDSIFDTLKNIGNEQLFNAGVKGEQLKFGVGRLKEWGGTLFDKMFEETGGVPGRNMSDMSDMGDRSDPGGPAAIQRGSSEAFSAIFAAMRNDQKNTPTETTQKQIVTETKNMKKAVEKLAGNAIQLVAGNV